MALSSEPSRPFPSAPVSQLLLPATRTRTTVGLEGRSANHLLTLWLPVSGGGAVREVQRGAGGAVRDGGGGHAAVVQGLGQQHAVGQQQLLQRRQSRLRRHT